MLNKKVERKLVEQIEKEGYSSNLYLSMANWADRNGFKGTAEWMYKQSDEERIHMLKIVKFINDRDGTAVIPAFDKPPTEFHDIKEVFQQSYEHEQKITSSINNIVEIALMEKDFTTENWLHWLVIEQIEEEAKVLALLDELKLLGNASLYFFDKNLMK